MPSLEVAPSTLSPLHDSSSSLDQPAPPSQAYSRVTQDPPRVYDELDEEDLAKPPVGI